MQIPGMDQETLLIIAAVVAVIVIVLIVVAVVVTRRRRRQRDELHDRFGPEYDRAVQSEGPRGAERDLHGRVQDRESFSPLDPGEETREALRQRMAALQYRFVEDPADVLLETQRSVTDMLRACGYPVAEDRERTLKLLSVDYPEVTPSLRTLLDGSYGHDVGRMQTLFLDAKRALREVARMGYGPDDVAETTPEAAADRAGATEARDRTPADRRADERRDTTPETRRPADAAEERRSVAPDEQRTPERRAEPVAQDERRS